MHITRRTWHCGRKSGRNDTKISEFFARSNRKFSSREVLLSGAVASDRSGNERAVKR